jgi:protein-S-isoprenylcysteine O-methyltransferase Ste14
METPPKQKSFSVPSFATHATRGIIRDQSSRRKTMSATLVVAVLMLILGTTFLQDLLNPREHALRFILYWVTCAWFTVAALLLALFDALMVRAQARAARKLLGKEVSPAKSASAEHEEDDQ